MEFSLWGPHQKLGPSVYLQGPYCGVDLSRCDGSLPLGGLDDGWTLNRWNEGPQTERVLARNERVQFVPSQIC